MNMCITRNQIKELKEVIDGINSFEDEKERTDFLNNHVEDVDLFISALRSINKKKLSPVKERKTGKAAVKYGQNEVIDIFKNNKLESIISEYSLNELSDMYVAIFNSTPISSFKKARIAQTINNYLYAMDRASELLH